MEEQEEEEDVDEELLDELPSSSPTSGRCCFCVTNILFEKIGESAM